MQQELGQRAGYKVHTTEANNQGSKYFGRITGGLLSSSRGFGGGSFFGRSAQAPAPQVNKVTRPLVTATDQSNAVKRDVQPAAALAAAKSATTGETRNSWTNFHRPVSPNMQPHPTGVKKSWHQLSSRSASVSPCPDVSASAREKNGQPEVGLHEGGETEVGSQGDPPPVRFDSRVDVFVAVAAALLTAAQEVDGVEDDVGDRVEKADTVAPR
uniref:Uncharacterized protein n=1 Tax=Phyllostachys edulis TaxID=38705 RepID=D3IVC4_PHYED|nr:hypothetical protein [Phyllostachys edulis]